MFLWSTLLYNYNLCDEITNQLKTTTKQMMKNKKPFRGRIWSGMAVGLLLSALPFYGSFAQVTIKMPNTTLALPLRKSRHKRSISSFMMTTCPDCQLMH